MLKNLAKLTAFLFIFVSLAYGADHTISGAEYYIDVDPGGGNGIPLNAKDGNFDSDVEEIDMSNIAIPDDILIGVHYIYVRMKNELGEWGFPRKYMFQVTGTKTIKAAEFFIGDDPGEGQGTPLTVNNNTIDVSDIDTSTFNIGINRIFVRMQNSEGNWGPTRQYDFEVLDQPKMKSADYYIDQLPESGEGTALNSIDGVFDSNEEYIKGVIDTANMDIGTYTLFVRAQDTHSRWGKPAVAKIEVTLPPHITGRVYTSIAGWNNLSIANSHVALEGTNYSATTDQNGYFLLEDVAPGDYTMVVTTPNFHPLTKTIKWTGYETINADLPPIERGVFSQADVDKMIKKYIPSLDSKVSLEEIIHMLKIVSGIIPNE